MRTPSLVLAVAVLAWHPPATSAEEQIPVALRVRLYDGSKGEPEVDDGALEEAATTLQRAGVSPQWVLCGAAPTLEGPDRCTVGLTAPELVVRLVRSRPSTSPTRSLLLGDAFVDTRARAGALATIYLDAVESLARASGCSPTVLLGRALAHEIGHLLVGTNGHSTRGIMRAVWTSDQLRDNRPADWRFSPDEAARITLASRPSTTSRVVNDPR